jgi:hypothetical protein
VKQRQKKSKNKKTDATIDSSVVITHMKAIKKFGEFSYAYPSAPIPDLDDPLLSFQEFFVHDNTTKRNERKAENSSPDAFILKTPQDRPFSAQSSMELLSRPISAVPRPSSALPRPLSAVTPMSSKRPLSANQVNYDLMTSSPAGGFQPVTSLTLPSSPDYNQYNYQSFLSASYASAAIEEEELIAANDLIYSPPLNDEEAKDEWERSQFKRKLRRDIFHSRGGGSNNNTSFSKLTSSSMLKNTTSLGPSSTRKEENDDQKEYHYQKRAGTIRRREGRETRHFTDVPSLHRSPGYLCYPEDQLSSSPKEHSSSLALLTMQYDEKATLLEIFQSIPNSFQQRMNENHSMSSSIKPVIDGPGSSLYHSVTISTEDQ